MAASGAKSGFGTVIQLSDNGGTPVFTTIAEVVSIGAISAQRNPIDCTHMLSDNSYHEFIGGLPDSGEVTLGLNFIATQATQVDLWTAIANQTDAGTLLSTDVRRIYRIIFPDATTSYTATFVTTTWTASGSHGWNTSQPITFTTSGVLPTTIVAGTIYFARRLSATTFSVHATAAAAEAGTGAISSTGGSGTHTVYSGTKFTFNAIVTALEAVADIDDKLMANVTFKISGIVTPA